MKSTQALLCVAAAACSAAVLAGCGTSTSSSSPPSAPSSSPATTGGASTPPTTGPTQPAGSPTSAPTPTTAAAAACATSALHVAVPKGSGNAAAGSSYYPIQFVNNSSSPCTLYGYPGVSFVTAVGGKQIGAAATRNPTAPARLLTVSPGQTVHAVLQVVDAMNYPSADCGPVTAHWLKIYPPNQTAPLYVSFTATACSKPKTVLSVETAQPGSTGP
jgi:hypothetical protein